MNEGRLIMGRVEEEWMETGRQEEGKRKGKAGVKGEERAGERDEEE